MWCVGDGRTDGRRQREIAILTHNFFPWPWHAVLFTRPDLALLLHARGCSTRELVWATGPSGALSVTASWLWFGPLWLQLTSRHLHILFYNAYNFCDCFFLFTQVRLWLTARSRVSMQPNEGILCTIKSYRIDNAVQLIEVNISWIIWSSCRQPDAPDYLTFNFIQLVRKDFI